MAYSDQLNTMDDPGELFIDSLDNLRSQETMRQGLQRFALYLSDGQSKVIPEIQWARLTHKDIQGFKARLLRDGLKPNSISSYLAAVRGALRKSATVSTVDPEKRIPHSALVEITEEVKAPRERGKKQLNFVSASDFKALIETCDDSPAGYRDKAILLLLRGCGLRRSEVVSLKHPGSINFVQAHLVIDGKGNKRREVPMFSEVEQAIVDWLELARGEAPGPLFFPLSKSGRLLTEKSLTAFGVADLVKRRCMLAGIEQYRPHDFRGTFATTLFQLDTDLFTVMQLMGHEDPSTTKRYDLRESEAGYEAIKKLGMHLTSTS